MKDFLKEKNIDILNTRAFKTKENNYIVTIGSISKDKSEHDVKFKNATFQVEYGEFESYLKEVN